MRNLMIIVAKRFSGLFQEQRSTQAISCNYSDNYYGDKQCFLERK